VKQLYESRLSQKITQNLSNREDTVDEKWRTLKHNILNAANEALGKRQVDVNRTNKTPEIKELSEHKKKAHIKYLRNGNQENWNQNRVNAKIREMKDYWERFTKEMERDMYGSQRKMWGMLRRNKLEYKDQ